MDRETLDKLTALKSLNMEQLAKCEDAAKGDVRRRLGDEPDRAAYMSRVDWRSTMQPNDYIGLVLFFTLLTISLIHMISFTGKLAKSAYETTAAVEEGIFFSIQAWIISHQLTFFAFSELGVLFFFIRHSMSYLKWRDDMIAQGREDVVEKSKWRRWISVASVAAFACAVVAIIANVTSLTHNASDPWTVAITGGIGFMIPMLTLFLGERAAEILTSFLYEKERAEAEWRTAHDQWRLYVENPQSYDEGDRVNSFRRYLARRIVEYYRAYIAPNAGIKATDWTPELELAVAGRELARLRRMEDLEGAEAFFTLPPSGAETGEETSSEEATSTDLSPSSVNGSTH